MKNMFSLDGKVAFGESNIGKNGRKWFSRDDFLCRFLLDEIFYSTISNKVFLSKLVFR